MIFHLLLMKEANVLVESQLIKQAIELAGNKYKAAEILGADQSTYSKKAKKYKTILQCIIAVELFNNCINSLEK